MNDVRETFYVCAAGHSIGFKSKEKAERVQAMVREASVDAKQRGWNATIEAAARECREWADAAQVLDDRRSAKEQRFAYLSAAAAVELLTPPSVSGAGKEGEGR